MKEKLNFYGIIFIGVSMIFSAFIITNSLRGLTNMNRILNGTLTGSLTGDLTGTLTVSDTDSVPYESDILDVFEASELLDYDYGDFIQDIKDNKLEGIPYTNIGKRYVFSKKALEEWVYNKSIAQEIIN